MQDIFTIFGTYKISLDSLLSGIDKFTYIDTATGYGNLNDVGFAIKKTKNNPKIIAKLNANDLIDLENKCNKMIEVLGKIPEIVLLHSPVENNGYYLKKIKDIFPHSLIGVSNFDIELLKTLDFNVDIISLEFSPYYQPKKLIEYCKSMNIIVTGYRCLAKGEACRDPLIIDLAKKYRTSASSILLSWSNYHGVIPIYSTNNPDHLMVEKIKLTDYEIKQIDFLDKGKNGATCMLKYCTHDE